MATQTHPSALWGWSLALGTRWCFQPEQGMRDSQRGISPSSSSPSSQPFTLSPGILGLLASSPIQWDNGLSADPSLTHRALLPLWPGLQPLQ